MKNTVQDDTNLSAFELVSASELTQIDGGTKPVVKHSGKDQQEYLKITLQDCLVCSYHPDH